MKTLFLFIIIIISSCNNNEVIFKKTEDLVIKYKCVDKNDTLNSIKYVYYKTTLTSQTILINGKKNGPVIDYYMNGEIKIITNYLNNKAYGLNKVYNERGQLIRRSVYIDDKQVLFEKREGNEEKPMFRIKRIAIINDKNNWAGELLLRKANTNSNEIEKDGLFVSMNIEDTIIKLRETPVSLEFTFPTNQLKSKILIGKFDKSLNCTDTIYYSYQDTINDYLSFNYIPEYTGYNFLVGRMSITDQLNEDIYFFTDFFVLNN
jgi:hypothetical protein